MSTSDTVPLRSKDVIARLEPGGVLLFQVRTDEMYFVSHGAYAVFGLCDGSQTVGEIAELIEKQQPELVAGTGWWHIESFVEGLAQRHLVELWRRAS